MAQFTPRNEQYEQSVRDYHDRTPLHRFLGMELESVEPGRVTVSMAKRDQFLQQNGYLHAGILISLADAAAGMAAWTLLDKKSNLLSVQISTSLQKAADCERVVAEGVVVKAGGRLMVSEATVYREGDESKSPLIRATVTLMVLSARG
jgi:uncharacterized protein (TIGR00369 family)